MGPFASSGSNECQDSPRGGGGQLCDQAPTGQRSCHLLHSLLTPGAKEHSHKFLSEKEGGILCPCLKIKSWGDSTWTAGAIPDHHHQGASRIASHCLGASRQFMSKLFFCFCFVSFLYCFQSPLSPKNRASPADSLFPSCCFILFCFCTVFEALSHLKIELPWAASALAQAWAGQLGSIITCI